MGRTLMKLCEVDRYTHRFLGCCLCHSSAGEILCGVALRSGAANMRLLEYMPRGRLEMHVKGLAFTHASDLYAASRISIA